MADPSTRVIHIEGHPVTVSDNFFKLSPEDQDKTVDEIAQKMGLQKAKGVARNITAGLNEGIYGTIGAPVDAARAVENLGIRGINYVAGTHIPKIPESSVGGSRWIAQKAGGINPALNPANTVATTPAERVARVAGQTAGYAVAPEAAVGGLEKAGLTRAAQVAGKIVGRSETAGQLAANTGVAAAAGAGAGTAEEAVPAPLKPVAGVVGGLAGGVAGVGTAAALDAARAGLKGAGSVADRLLLTGGARERAAARRLQGAATSKSAAVDAIDNGTKQIIPGSQPTTFQQTGDMGLGGLEREYRTKNSLAFMQRAADQNKARVAAVTGIENAGAPEQVAAVVRNRLDQIDQQTQAAMDQAAKTAEAAHSNVSNAVQARAEGLGTRSQSAVDAATTNAQTQATGIGHGIAPAEAGATLRASLEAARAKAKTEERALWDAVDPNGTLALAPTHTQQVAKQIAREMPVSAGPMLPAEQDIQHLVSQYGNSVPLREMTALRSRIASEMRSERLAHGDSAAYRRLAQLNSAVADDLDAAVAGKVAEQQKAVAQGQLDPEQTLMAIAQKWADDWYTRKAETRAVNSTSAGWNARGRPTAISGARGATRQTGIALGNASSNPRLSANAPNFDEAARGRLNAARGATQERVNTFDNRTLGPIRRRPSTASPYDMPASAVPGRVFVPGPKGAETIATYRKAVGDPEAMNALEGYVVDQLRHEADPRNTGILDPKAVARFQKRYSGALAAFPELNGKIDAAVQASNKLAEVQAEHKATMSLADKLRRNAVAPDGTVDPAKLDAWREKNKAALEQFPDLAPKFSDAQSASETLAQAAAHRRAAVADAQKGALGKIAGLDSPEDVTHAVGGIFSRQDAVKQFTNLRKAIGDDQEAQKGLRRAITDFITRRFIGNTEAATTGIGTIKADGLQTFLKNNQEALKAAGFTDEEIGTMNAVAKDLQRANRSNAALKLPNQSDTAQDLTRIERGGGRTTSILIRVMEWGGFGVGGIFGGLAGAATGGAMGDLIASMRQSGVESVDKMIEDALLHPGRAKLLLEKPIGPKQTESLVKRLASMYRRSAVATSARTTGMKMPNDNRTVH